MATVNLEDIYEATEFLIIMAEKNIQSFVSLESAICEYDDMKKGEPCKNCIVWSDDSHVDICGCLDEDSPLVKYNIGVLEGDKEKVFSSLNEFKNIMKLVKNDKL